MFDDSEKPLRESDQRMILTLPWIVLVESSFALVAVALGWIFGTNPLTTLDWNVRGGIVGLAASLPLIAFLWGTTRWPTAPIRRMEEFLREELLPRIEGASWLDLAMMAVAAGIGEELLFRGVVQGLIADQFGIAVGLVVASLLFGLFHPASKFYILLATAFGLYFGALWLISGNMLSAMVAHAVYDFVALVALTSRRGDADN